MAARVCQGSRLAVFVLVGLASRATGSAFLRRSDLQEALPGIGSDFERVLQAELEEAFSASGQQWRAAEGRAVHIKEALRPTFVSMPKNEHGKLGHAAVRYVLHRLFVSRHGWFIQGLQPDGDARDSANSSGIIHDQVPERVQELFEKRLGGHGLGLDEITVLAATLEHLVHSEVSGHVASLFELGGFSAASGVISTEAAQKIIDTYMAIYLVGGNASSMSAAEAARALRGIQRVYPSWGETQKFVHDIFDEVAPARGAGATRFADVVRVAEEVGERYGRWQDSECRGLKDKLARYGDLATGRVRLADFYRGAVHDGHYEFSESIAYLREIGALDESDATNPRVIVPNYINGPSNCVASSSYYSVCCINECEGLLGHLEERLGAADGSPAEIAALVTSLPSATRAAGRDLSAPLVDRLQDVAEHHGGRVPLHGRLFAQWLHLAYPMECPFPHLAGTANPVKAADWRRQTGSNAMASRREMDQHIQDAPEEAATGPQEEGTCGMWTMTEELVAGGASPAAGKRTRSWARAAIQGAMLLSAAVSMGLAAVRAGSAALPLSKGKVEKCLV
ncbi:unnamed protein product [Prorocentrum cordatum]|uniref:Selenoprotein O n=1 Tax=Prorocentrum cordatum TaxID=2364126 RepID=A0ABN9Y0X8_9DINO|nr:unnamed protein product [Polarella glacialis]